MKPVDPAPPHRQRGETPGGGVKVAAIVGAAAFVLGVLTSFGQSWLPDEARSIANSAGTWTLVAFLLALPASTAWSAAISGGVSLLALVAGYFIASLLRDFGVSTVVVMFWATAAATAGPILGVGAFCLRVNRSNLAALALGSVAGVLIGEGAYGLRYIADTTYPPFWWGEVIGGVTILGVGTVARLRRPWQVAIAVATTGAVATSFVALYSQVGSTLG